MELKELRIGNYINYPLNIDKQPIVVNGIVGNKILTDSFEGDAECFFPIILNEEWMDKLGFEHIVNEFTKVDFWQLKRKRNEYHKPVIVIYKDRTTVGNNTYVKHLKFVHQVQNLYFILSGEELEVK
ncbi:hypothetical protein [Chryseobacterium proteolyticum]|uniref:hypothetical protein n=1 Tax=Chryseobacterium proteolyticum TaxID=118127 RepID=UPI0039838E97